MTMPSASVLQTELEQLKTVYANAVAKFYSPESLQDHVIDPLASCLHCSLQGIAFDDFLKMERARRIDKAMTNAIGKFHENILASIPGWIHPKSGLDLICESRKIVAEVKNKHNTANSSMKRDIRRGLEEYISQKSGYTAYLVTIIPKDRKSDEPWQIPKKSKNENIRMVDGATFYNIVTREDDALERVYDMIFASLKVDDELTKKIKELMAFAYGRQ